jgi:hypothetical protein
MLTVLLVLALVVRRGVELVKRWSSAPHLLGDLFGGLAPDEGLGIVVPVRGPQLYRSLSASTLENTPWRRRRSVRSLNQPSTRLSQELEVGVKWGCQRARFG